jgi:hypothetical protein
VKIQSDNGYQSNVQCHAQFKAIDPDEFDEAYYWYVHNYTRYFSDPMMYGEERDFNPYEEYADVYEDADFSYIYAAEASMGLVALGLGFFGVRQRRRRLRSLEPALDIKSVASNEATSGFEMMGSDSVRV